jgi:cytochrome c oxidase subunit 2
MSPGGEPMNAADQSSDAFDPAEIADHIDEAALAEVMRVTPLGAGVLAGTAVALLVLGYLAIYLLVFLPRGRSVSVMTDRPVEIHERRILGTELLWAFGVGVLIAATLSVIVFTALTRDINPPSNVERIDPKTLHLSGEFAEHNLGTTVGSDGRITVRAIATQFMFVPRCIAVPQGRPVTLRFASPDVIHGLLITGTNVNTMVVPGFVSQIHTEFTRGESLLMPCHEYCGLGHSEMWATVQVMRDDQFKPDRTGGFPVRNVERLCLRTSGWRSRHFWSPAAGHLADVVRSPWGAHVGTPSQYFMSVTAHGVAMAYVLTTFFIMGFGYFVAVTSLHRPLPARSGRGPRSGWRSSAW